MKIGSYVRAVEDSWGYAYMKPDERYPGDWRGNHKMVTVSSNHRYLIVGALESGLVDDNKVYVLLMIPQCIITYLTSKEVVEVLCSGLVIW